MTTISLIQGEVLLQEKTINLHDLFREMGSVLVALSGGIDSTLALKIAHDVLGDQVVAVTATSPTFPEIELEAVHRVSQEIGARLIIVETNQLTLPAFVQNDGTRCYHCKTDL
ncbi:MAG: 7-cyano-7-deazaguanine synthase, partial [Nitrospirae bacterium]|nr:7-cyano-7-deazaguanine synthase [Nitrospirota bacterium]